MKLKELKKLKPMQLIRLTKKYEKWLLESAFDLNKVGDGIQERHFNSAFLSKYIGHGLPHIVQFLEYKEDVGDGPGAKILITLPFGYQQYSFVGRKEIKP